MTEEESLRLRRALGAFPTGVAVVTAMSREGRPIGLTVNSFASVSLDPPLVLWCLGNASDAYPDFAEAPAYCVNLMSEDAQDLALRFAKPGDHEVGDLSHDFGASGAPILVDAMAHFDCRVSDRLPGGDHLILIGEVLGFTARDDVGALTFFRGAFGRID